MVFDPQRLFMFFLTYMTVNKQVRGNLWFSIHLLLLYYNWFTMTVTKDTQTLTHNLGARFQSFLQSILWKQN